MVATTFLNDNEIDQPLSSPEAQKLLDEVRKVTGKNRQLTEYEFFRTKRKNLIISVRETYSRWQLCVYVGGFVPWQIINFFVEDSDTSINGLVSLDLIMAYLHGVLAGHQTQSTT